jgi:Predicted methyltransferase
MKQIAQKLKDFTDILLEPEDRYGEVKSAVDGLYDMLTHICEFNESAQANRDDIFLPDGKAIGPVWAAMCIKEFMRTKRFLQGIRDAIVQAKERFPQRPVRILYAGTGPFAALILPLTTVFSSEDITCTLLEINPGSIAALRRIIEAFGIEGYIAEIVQCDAARYRVKPGQEPHILITEIMQNALKKEPQVAVTLNLAPQLAEGGILIPEEVTVEAAFIKYGADAGIEKLPLGRIYRLDKNTTLENTRQGITVDIPDDLPSCFSRLALLTGIRVYGKQELALNQCSLTLPYRIADFDDQKAIPKRALFQYILSDRPHFSCDLTR